MLSRDSRGTCGRLLLVVRDPPLLARHNTPSALNTQVEMRPALPPDALRNLEDRKASVAQLLDMGAQEVGGLCHNFRAGGRVLAAARMLPFLEVCVRVARAFRCVPRVVGHARFVSWLATAVVLSCAWPWSIDGRHPGCHCSPRGIKEKDPSGIKRMIPFGIKRMIRLKSVLSLNAHSLTVPATRGGEKHES